MARIAQEIIVQIVIIGIRELAKKRSPWHI